MDEWEGLGQHWQGVDVVGNGDGVIGMVEAHGVLAAHAISRKVLDH